MFTPNTEVKYYLEIQQSSLEMCRKYDDSLKEEYS